MVLSILFGIVLALAFPEDSLPRTCWPPTSWTRSCTSGLVSVALLLPSALLARLVLGPRPLGLIFLGHRPHPVEVAAPALPGGGGRLRGGQPGGHRPGPRHGRHPHLLRSWHRASAGCRPPR
ncbi:hypothetical protein QJS66_10650 [Kocuria rhizophila]|nr:hypothetical protein QJS66_10650 [Kocuria rhizophila]